MAKMAPHGTTSGSPQMPLSMKCVLLRRSRSVAGFSKALWSLMRAGLIACMLSPGTTRAGVNPAGSAEPDATFDMAQHYTGWFTAPSFDRLLGAVTQGMASAPYAWRRIGDTYVVYPRERSLLDYSVSFNTEALTVEQAVEKILDQKPQVACIGLMKTYVGPARSGTDPMPGSRPNSRSFRWRTLPPWKPSVW